MQSPWPAPPPSQAAPAVPNGPPKRMRSIFEDPLEPKRSPSPYGGGPPVRSPKAPLDSIADPLEYLHPQAVARGWGSTAGPPSVLTCLPPPPGHCRA